MPADAKPLAGVPSRLRAPRRANRFVRLCFGFLTVLAAIVVNPAQVEAQEYGFLGAPGHWCTFNRACNWTAHAGIAFGTTYALDKLGVPLPLAAGTGAALFVGKEVRDHMKWGDFWTFDSLVDLGTGVVGAGLAYWLLKPDEHTVAAPFVDADGRMGLELRLPLL